MEKQEYLKMYELENRFWWFLAKQKFISAIFPKIIRPHILDIGSGTGGTTKFLQKYGLVAGIEANKLAVSLAKKRKLNVVKGKADKLPFKNNIFDMVCIFDVLYHRGIKSDIKVLKEAYRVLKPSGFLVVTDCAFEFLRGPHDEAMQARQRYTKSKLVNKITRVGFSVEKASYIFWLLFPLAVMKRFIVQLQAKFIKQKEFSDVAEVPTIINNILLAICYLEAKLLPHFNFPWGSSIIIRARK